MRNSYSDLSPKQRACFIASALAGGSRIRQPSKPSSNLASWRMALTCINGNHTAHFNVLLHYQMKRTEEEHLQCIKNQLHQKYYQEKEKRNISQNQ